VGQYISDKQKENCYTLQTCFTIASFLTSASTSNTRRNIRPTEATGVKSLYQLLKSMTCTDILWCAIPNTLRSSFNNRAKYLKDTRSTIFWNLMSCSLVEVYWHFACLVYTSILKMEAVRSSETSVNLYQTTRCHSPEVTGTRASNPSYPRKVHPRHIRYTFIGN
jgi:hypothetical protein